MDLALSIILQHKAPPVNTAGVVRLVLYGWADGQEEKRDELILHFIFISSFLLESNYSQSLLGLFISCTFIISSCSWS